MKYRLLISQHKLFHSMSEHDTPEDGEKALLEVQVPDNYRETLHAELIDMATWKLIKVWSWLWSFGWVQELRL